MSQISKVRAMLENGVLAGILVFCLGGVVLGAWAHCSVCVLDALNPMCGSGGANSCSNNSGNCGSDSSQQYDCIQWTDSPVDTCQSNTSNDCHQLTTDVTCSVGVPKQVCNIYPCVVSAACPQLTLTMKRCDNNRVATPFDCGSP
jgi:hypothetical protein